MAHKKKFIEGEQVYAVRKAGRKIRYSVKMLGTPAITLVCNIKGNRLEKVEEK
jgi:hypothetical protein